MPPDPQIIALAPIPERGGNPQVADQQLEGIPGNTTPDRSTAPILPCPWCGALVERIERGGHIRRFCPNTNHRSSYNSAMRKVALWYAELISTPGALQHWQDKACTLRQRATPASRVSGCPEK